MQFADNRKQQFDNNPGKPDIWQQRYNALEHNSNAQNFGKFCEELLRHPDKTYTSVVGKLREHSHGKLSPEEDRLKDRDAWARTTFGKNDQMVARVQASLAMAGYELGDSGVKGVDGIPGPKTEKAIKEFQASIGLKPTGKLDQETMKALDLATAKGLTKKEIEQIGKNIAIEVQPGQKPVEPLQTKELKPEARKRIEVRDALVQKVDFSKDGNYQLAQGQASLKMAGYELGKHGIDGKMGPDTNEALKAFQKDRGLPQTGKLDTETMNELNRVTADGWKRPERQEKRIRVKLYNEEVALEKILKITIGHEAPDKFQTVGNPGDNMGLSYGIFQWNIGQGTFQDLLRDFDTRPENKGILEKYLGEKKAKQLRDNVLSKSDADGLGWAKENISDGKYGVKEDWKTAFEKLGAYDGMKKIQVEHAINKYIKPAFELLNDLGLDVTDRGLAVANDIRVQGGGLYKGSVMIDGQKVKLDKNYYLSHLNDSMSYQEKLVTIIGLRASACSPQWERNFAVRKIYIAAGYGYTSHGEDKQLSDKSRFNLDSQEILNKEVGKQNNYKNWIDRDSFDKKYSFEDIVIDKQKFGELLTDIDKIVRIIDQI